MAKRDRKVAELTKTKPRKEEERFFVTFSETQGNAVLLLILSATFLVQGIVRYLEIVGGIELLQRWFIVVLLGLIFLIMSVVSMSLRVVAAQLKVKRILNVVSFLSFIFGCGFFIASLVYLLPIL